MIPTKKLPRHFLKPLLTAALTLQLSAESGVFTKWTNPEGKIIEAEFVAVTDQYVSLKIKGQPQATQIPHAKLSAVSLEEARRMDSEKKNEEKKLAAANEGKFKLAGQWITRGQRTEVIAEITDKSITKELGKLYGKPTTRVKINVIVPEKFDPADKNSLVVLCQSPGRNISFSALSNFTRVALEENALVMALDGEFGHPGQNDTPAFRANLLRGAMEVLLRDHPANQWSFIHVGNSGGSGNASYVAMYMMSNDWRVAGCFLGVGNYSPVMWDKDISLKTPQKKQLRLYYSFGENDKVCPTDLQDKMLAELKKSQYTDYRVFYHKKGHGFEESHWKEAIQWFKEPLNL